MNQRPLGYENVPRFPRWSCLFVYEQDSRKGLPADSVDKLRKMLAFLQAMAQADEVRTIPGWRAHRLTGDRAGTWSLRVTGNWRLTFRGEQGELVEVNYEDYHG